MSRMTAPAETAAQTICMCAKLLNPSPTIGALMGTTERQTQSESHCNSDDVIHPQPHGRKWKGIEPSSGLWAGNCQETCMLGTADLPTPEVS